MNDLEPNTLFAERYRVLCKLGSGSIGQAYLTEDAIRKEKVVVKVIFRDLVDDAGGWDNMIPILRKICSINHPGVMRVYDFNRWQDQVYLTTEHLVGTPLSNILQSGDPPITHETITKWLTELSESLVWAEKTMGHLGIKPNNIWIQRDGSTKLADYGFATLIPLEKRKATAIAQGRSAYLPPEIYAGSDWSPFAVDQYALGQVVQELILELQASRTFRNPTKTPSFHRFRIISETLAQRNPTDRYQTIEALQEAIKGTSVAPSSSRGFFKRFIGSILRWKRPLLIISIAALLVTIATSLLPSRNHFSQGLEQRLQELSTVRATWNDYHQARMTFLAKLSPKNPESRMIWRALDPVNEIDWIGKLETLNRHQASERPARFQSDLRQLKRRLNEFRETLHLIKEAMEALQELRRLKGDAGIIKQQHPQLPLSTQLLSNKAVAEVETMLTRQLFSHASRSAQTILTETRSMLDKLAHETRTLASSSQALWHTNLKNARLPVVDPSAVPNNKLQEGRRAEEAENLPLAIDRYLEASHIYDRWNRTWEAASPPAPEHWINSLGMRFVSIGGQLVSIWETRFLDYALYINATGADTKREWREAAAKSYASPLHPVCSIDDFDAHQFCEWLTAREQENGFISRTHAYRLPSDREWSLIAGLEYEEAETPSDRHLHMQDHWPWENSNRPQATRGNYFTFPHASEDNNFFDTDPYLESSPVGSFPPNSRGIYDLGGNVWEFTATRMNGKHPSEPKATNAERAIRGASWRTVSLEAMRTSFRLSRRAGREDIGFRCILSPIQGNPSPQVESSH